MRKHGIAPERFLEIVKGKVLRSPIYESYGALIAEEIDWAALVRISAVNAGLGGRGKGEG